MIDQQFFSDEIINLGSGNSAIVLSRNWKVFNVKIENNIRGKRGRYFKIEILIGMDPNEKLLLWEHAILSQEIPS